MKTKLLTSLDEHLDKHHGKRGTERRKGFEKAFLEFYRGVKLEIEKDEKIKARKRRLPNATSSTTNSRYRV